MYRVLVAVSLWSMGCSSEKGTTKDPIEADPSADTADTQPGDDGDTRVDLDGDGYLAIADGGDDCNDEDETIYPNATEWCDGIDNDCDGVVDNDASGQSLFYVDADGDGYGDPDSPVEQCEGGSGLSEIAGDCDDSDAEVYAGAPEKCDGIDNDCDPSTEEEGVVVIEGGTTSWTSIQEAIDASAEGDVVEVCSGTYEELLSIPHELSIIGMNGRDETILDAGYAGTAIESSAGLTLVGLTVRQGMGTVGGLSFSGSGGTVTIQDSLITSHVGEVAGGIYAEVGFTVQLVDSEVTFSSADTGGGITATLVDMVRSSVESNSATYGGGVWLDVGEEAGVLSMDDDSTVRDNTAYTAYMHDICGGCVLITGTEGATVSGGSIEDCFSYYWGGAVCIQGEPETATTVSIEDTTISGSQANWYGAGIYNDSNMELSITDTVFDDNYATYGGGLYDAGAGSYLLHATFQDNVASRGGAIYLTDDSGPMMLADCIVESGEAAWGGGALVEGSTLESVSTDWGKGSTDNTPDDVRTVSSNQTWSWNGSASFTCTSTACE